MQGSPDLARHINNAALVLILCRATGGTFSNYGTARPAPNYLFFSLIKSTRQMADSRNISIQPLVHNPVHSKA